MELSMVDDGELIVNIGLKQTRALGELYDRYGRLLYSIAFAAVRNSETAEEIVQDVFARVWGKANTYHGEMGTVKNWLVRITRNRAIDELRKNKVRPEQYSVSWTDFSLDGEPQSHGAEDDPDQLWVRDSVREAVSGLSMEQRQVLALAYFKGYTQREIAEVIDEPLSTVKSRIYYAMQNLRAIFTETTANKVV
jgi:RNA polymerase sigma-70 factor (ECF subfamily)